MAWVLVKSSAGRDSGLSCMISGFSEIPGDTWGGVEQAVIITINSTVIITAETVFFIIKV
jgi:hypothetical protein